MADELVFYTNPQSRGLTTHWMLEEIGCPYRMEVKAYGPEMKAPDYLAINPMGKVPALKHGDTVVTETGAILCYLADAYPAAKLAPPAGDRGAYYRWGCPRKRYLFASLIQVLRVEKSFAGEP
jgi:glutathione S-transferase